MSKINVHHACQEDFQWKKSDIDAIALSLVNGERVFIEPFGEVLLIMDANGMPSVQFTLNNMFIHTVIGHQIAKLQCIRYQLEETDDDAQ